MNLIKDVFKTVFSEKVAQGEAQQEKPKSEVRESYSGEIVDSETITPKVKTTKTNEVLKHLQEKGSIDSWTAIQQYGATRLSAIIYILRKRGYDIVSVPNSVLDRNNNVCNYTIYKLLSK